jgi:hypothetical protein
MKAARVVEFPTKNRADRIRVLLDRRDDVDRKIALELREAKAKDFKGDTAAWLAWCKREFGWSKVQAYVHLNPERLAKERARDRERKAGVRESRTDDLEYIDEDEEPDETEAERQVRWKKQVEDAQRRMKFTTPPGTEHARPAGGRDDQRGLQSPREEAAPGRRRLARGDVRARGSTRLGNRVHRAPTPRQPARGRVARTTQHVAPA